MRPRERQRQRQTDDRQKSERKAAKVKKTEEESHGENVRETDSKTKYCQSRSLDKQWKGADTGKQEKNVTLTGTEEIEIVGLQGMPCVCQV